MAVRHDADPKALLAARRREAAKPGRQKMSGRGSGLTPKVRKAIEALVFDDSLAPATRLKEAAERVGLSVSSLRTAMLKPAVDAFYRTQLTLYRNGERAQSLRTLAEIRDDPRLKGNAAGATAQIKAAERLAFDQPGQLQQTNVQVNVDGRPVTPGYVIDLRRDKSEPGRRIGCQVGGMVLDQSPKQPRIIDHDAAAETVSVEEVFEFPPQPMLEIPENN